MNLRYTDGYEIRLTRNEAEGRAWFAWSDEECAFILYGVTCSVGEYDIAAEAVKAALDWIKRICHIGCTIRVGAHTKDLDGLQPINLVVGFYEDLGFKVSMNQGTESVQMELNWLPKGN